MNTSRQIQLLINNAIPHGNTVESGSIIGLWQQLGKFFRQREFLAQCLGKTAIRKYAISLDASPLLAIMETAVKTAGSFDGYLQAHVHDETKSLAAALLIEVGVADGRLEVQEAYEVATLFLQQVVITVNLLEPGAFQMLHTRFRGEGAYLFEAQTFDSKLFYGAGRNLKDCGWWQRQTLSLDAVWAWLDKTGVSHAHTAIKGINKVLFSLLKVAEQRNEYSARTVLLVVYQLELLLDCQHRKDANRLRSRIRMILGELPEAADCINALYEVRDGMFLGSQPVNRPAMISHSDRAEFMEQIGLQNTAVELGVALALVLLRELIGKHAKSFEFQESFKYR